MGKAIGGLPEAPPLRGRGEPGLAGGCEAEPIGAYLARQRRLRGISLAELAALTRIPRRSLERLEAGAFDGQPDGFVRGFVRTVAEGIGLDPVETVTRMLPEPGTRPRSAWAGVRRVLLAALALALAGGFALGVAWLWREGAGGAAAPPARERSLEVRRDAVRALAVAEGLVPAERAPHARPLAPAAGEDGLAGSAQAPPAELRHAVPGPAPAPSE
jgi:hypothetical protein